MEERELLLERLELALDRIREIPGEDWQEESLQHWKGYFTAVAKFLLLIEDTRQFLEQGKQNTATLEELKQRNHVRMKIFYRKIMRTALLILRWL